MTFCNIGSVSATSSGVDKFQKLHLQILQQNSEFKTKKIMTYFSNKQKNKQTLQTDRYSAPVYVLDHITHNNLFFK